MDILIITSLTRTYLKHIKIFQAWTVKTQPIFPVVKKTSNVISKLHQRWFLHNKWDY